MWAKIVAKGSPTRNRDLVCLYLRQNPNTGNWVFGPGAPRCRSPLPPPPLTNTCVLSAAAAAAASLNSPSGFFFFFLYKEVEEMQRVGRSAIRLKSSFRSLWIRYQNGVSSSLSEPSSVKHLAREGLASFSTSTAPIRTSTGSSFLYGGNRNRKCVASFRPPSQLLENGVGGAVYPCLARTFASKASGQEGKNNSEPKKEVTTIEDPFDAPTYNIPEKPVTFTEGASYSLIILAGLGVAAAAGYAVFKELIFEPKEYTIFNKALKRIQDDPKVRVRIGSPITGYGQESRNRAARQRIPHKIFTDEDGVEHILINFFIRGPHGAGKVTTEMFKDKEDKQWKYTYLIVQIMEPSQSNLILESYMPAPAAIPA